VQQLLRMTVHSQLTCEMKYILNVCPSVRIRGARHIPGEDLP
jgi:hypothetical protein